MKRTFLNITSAVLLIAAVACNNETASKSETETTTEVADKPEDKKTEVSIGDGGAEVKTKSGTEIKISDTSKSVESKDVKIKIDQE